MGEAKPSSAGEIVSTLLSFLPERQRLDVAREVIAAAASVRRQALIALGDAPPEPPPAGPETFEAEGKESP